MVRAAWWKLSFVWLTNLSTRTPPARRSLVRNSARVALIGLALGVAALSVTCALFTGAENVFARSLISSLGHVTHFTGWKTKEEMDRIARAAPEGVDHVVYFWTSQALFVGPSGGRGVMIEGRLGTGTPVEPNGPVLVELGRPLAETLGVKVGETVRLLLPGVLKGSVEAKVIKLLDNGMYDLDSRLAIVVDESLRPVIAKMDPEAASHRPGDAHGLRYTLKPGGHAARDATWVDDWNTRYREKLQSEGLFAAKDFTRSWKDLQKNLLGSVGLDKQILVILMGLLTLVATLNVAATLVVLYLERDREIAVLRALGLSKGGLVSWIGTQGVLLGLGASTLGLVLARVFGWLLQKLPIAELPADIYRIARLPFDYEVPEQLATFAFGVIACWGIALLLGTRLARSDYLATLGSRR